MRVTTKAELIQFLEPFGDDIKIVVEEDLGCLDTPNPRYVIGGRGEYLQEYEEEKGISRGEGYLVL